jgi:lipid II:glycine glycyltransferase (peptidoglycan interpeptide bridge formation enzyme)
MVRILTPPADAWDAFVAAHPAGHILQTPAWGELKAAFGWQCAQVALAESDRIVAGAQLLFRPLPLRLATVAYIPKGPIVDWDDHKQAALLWGAIDQAARAHRAAFLKIEPGVEDSLAWRGRLADMAFQPSPQTLQPPRTIYVDIAPDEETILAAMKSKTRYNVGLAARKGVSVREGSDADVATFNRLMGETGERDRFGVHSPEYYELAYRLFVTSSRAALLLAEYEGRPLAGLMVFALGRMAWYFYGASSNEQRNLMPTYLLQWEAMRWAKARGCTVYDLWGIPDADEETLEAQFSERHDGLWGVYRFKRGFGGRVVRGVGAWDRVYNPPLYWAYTQYMHRRGAKDAEAAQR